MWKNSKREKRTDEQSFSVRREGEEGLRGRMHFLDGVNYRYANDDTTTFGERSEVFVGGSDQAGGTI